MSRKTRKRAAARLKSAKADTKPVTVQKNTHYRLVLVPTGDVPQCWPLGAEYIEQSSVFGEFHTQELATMCLSGEAQLWFVWSDKCDAAGITTMKHTPQGVVMMVLAFGGKNMKAWWDTQDDLYAWAKRNGADTVRIYGRIGWARILEKKGFNVMRVILDKGLNDER